MIKFIKKAQQDYIAAKLNDQRMMWSEVDGGVCITDTEGTALYHIPDQYLYIKLQEKDRSRGLKGVYEKDDGYKPATYKGCTVDGLHIFTVDGVTVIARQKVAKQFLVVKGARFRIKGEKDPIRCYTETGYFLGLFLPTSKDPNRSYEL